MPFYLVLLAYGSAAAVAVLLLYRFEPIHWVLHVISLIAALAIGFMKLPPELTTPEGTLVVGAAFSFLFIWGAFAPFFHRWHYHAQKHSAHHTV